MTDQARAALIADAEQRLADLDQAIATVCPQTYLWRGDQQKDATIIRRLLAVLVVPGSEAPRDVDLEDLQRDIDLEHLDQLADLINDHAEALVGLAQWARESRRRREAALAGQGR